MVWGTMAKATKAKPKSAAAKKAMAERGTFKREADADTYAPLVYAAVRPYVAASARSVAVWGDTLAECVPPAYAVRYRELKDELDCAMRASDVALTVAAAESLIKALEVMDANARASGHQPPAVDGVLCERGDKVYCFVISGSLSAIRQRWPTWLVYHVSDVCAIMENQWREMMAAIDTVANAFPDAKVTRYTPTSLEDRLDF